jgi:cytoskeletal protein CcmA (bactofilin family)
MSSSKNILSSDVEIHGNLKFSHDLIIDGKIEGEVTSDGCLTVGENARIKGEIKTKAVTVFGKVEGNITVSERCELKSNAELLGDIKAGTLSIEEGATFMGTSTVGAAARSSATGTPSSMKPPVPPVQGAGGPPSVGSSSGEKKLAVTR